MQKVKLFLLPLVIAVLSCANNPHENTSHVQWMSLDEASAQVAKQQKPVLIDLYTTWCGWCKVMDKKTYSNQQVIDYVHEKFYAVKVNAESHDTFTWRGKQYHFNPQYKTNEFAVYLTGGRLEFPTTIIIPPNGEPQAIPGYMEPKDFQLIATYFGEDQFGKTSFDDYVKNFRATWK